WLRALKKAGWWTKGGKVDGDGAGILPPERRIVWAWWGAEELGLVGSQYFAEHSVGPLNVVAAINVDMIASPNGVPRVVNASSAPLDATIPPSQKIQNRLEKEFRLGKESWERADTNMFNSDDWSFLEVGVPTGGLLNGASRLKTQSQREVHGGIANAPFDPCWHQSCDTFENVNVSLLKLMSRVGFNAVQYLAKKKDLKEWLWNGSKD
ncbi:Leucyl aminopeptidase yscIV, partial [Tulasnella sp. 427]